MPTPMLKVLNMSCSLMLPTRCIRVKMGSTGIADLVILAESPSVSILGMFS